jgi:SAM-dependent methyltransferase
MNPEDYWNRAGEVGYDATYYVDKSVGEHISGRMRSMAIGVARQLGIVQDARVLDVGCGDGSFANEVLAKNFRLVDGIDLSEAGINRARSAAPRDGIRFEVCDLTKVGFTQAGHFDAAFLMGILHQVKTAAPDIVKELRAVTNKVVVLEPNGDNLVRKLLEYTPSYRAAGEDSFRTAQVEKMFEKAGYRKVTWLRVNLFPNFTPGFIFRLLRPFEPGIERNTILRSLCTVNFWGFISD